MEINRKGFFDYYLVMSYMTTLFLAILTPQLLVLPCHRFENFLLHISTSKKTKRLIKFTQLNASSSSNPFSASYVNEMNRMKLFEFHPSTTIYNGAPHLITYDYNSWPKQWSINKDQNSNVFWTEIVKSIHFCIQWYTQPFHHLSWFCSKPAIKARAITPWDELLVLECRP